MRGSSGAAAPRGHVALALTAAYVAILVASNAWMLEAKPWNLPDYKECESRKLSGLDNDSSGVTYSPVTNSIWVVARVPKRIGEYSVLKGDRLRTLDTSKLKLNDPEGLSWMYDYTFAIACEASPKGREYSSVVIVEIVPWRSKPTLKRTLTLKIDQEGNEGLESVSWDSSLNKLIMGQEMKPISAYEVDPVNGKWKKILTGIEYSSKLRDIAGIYRRPGMKGVYALSEPIDTIWELDDRGKLIRNQKVVIKGAFMPEGISFTPDGALLFVVGEPNELYIYSSIGTCKWSPSDDYEFKNPSLSPSEDSSETPEPPSPPAPPPVPISEVGFCNWNNCVGGPQGISWCRTSVYNCVGPCGGTFCYFDQSNDPIAPLPEAPPSPPSPPPSPPPPSPWFEDDSTGYCNYRDCDGTATGEAWCQGSMYNCLSCKGTWCPKASVPGDVVGIGPDGPLESPSSSTSSRSSASDGLRSDNEDEKPDIEIQAQGYQAVLTILLDGAEEISATQAEQLEKLVAKEGFPGYEDAFTQVAMLNSSQVVDEPTRRRAQEMDEPMPSIQRVVMRLYGETAHHANAIQKNVQTALSNGHLQKSLAEAGLALEAQFAGVAIEGAGMSPEQFPVSTDVELEYTPDIMVDFTEGQGLGPVELAAVVCGAVLFVTILAASAFWFAYRKSSKWPSSAERTQSKAVSEMQPISESFPRVKKSTSHGALLALNSAQGTPVATPGHSRQASLITEDTAVALESTCFSAMVATVVEEAASPAIKAVTAADDVTLTVSNNP